MSRYTPVSTGPSSPVTPSASNRPSFASIRRPSVSSFRFGSSRNVNSAARVPDPEEMDAAFDGPEPDDETDGPDGEQRGLLSNATPERRVPGDYDFERDYTQPPSSPPPFQPYSSHNPAPGNTNGIVALDHVARPTPNRHFLGGILPTSFLPRSSSPNPHARVMGAGNTGVFTNLSARPGTGAQATDADGNQYVPEDEQKEGPPSYQAALRDTVPPYWETTVVLPSSSSPFGPLSSSMSGDEILIDGMPSGNFFAFLWNMIVSVSFQFVGFLLTYVLHTTHSAKYGSRVGLGLTLIQFGFNLRSKAEQLIDTGRFPTDPSDPSPDQHFENEEEEMADNAFKAIWGAGSVYPFQLTDPDAPLGSPPVTIHNIHEAETFAHDHNRTLGQMFDLPSAADVGRANEYFSFMLMTIGWFVVLTSLGGLWRVKRFERGLRQAQRDSEEAQAAANRSSDTDAPNQTTEETSTSTNPPAPGPTSLAYYTNSFSEAMQGANHIRRGFLGQLGPRVPGMGMFSRRGRTQGHGHELVPGEDLDAAEAYEIGNGELTLETMASDGEGGSTTSGRRRGLWGI